MSEIAEDQLITWERKQSVAICRIDIPDASQNVLNLSIQTQFQKILEQVENDDNVKAVVIISGKTGSFIAGADIKMLKKSKSAEETTTIARTAQDHFDKLEKSKKPIVAAIMGSCMGAGLELSLACHYRIAVNDSKTLLALPEVMIGLLPGAGGTQRLPKLISLQNALDIILTGKKISAKKALEIGLVDKIVEVQGSPQETHKHLEEVATEIAQKLADRSLVVNRNSRWSWREWIADSVMRTRLVLDYIVLKTARDKVMKETFGNYPAPLKILEVVRTGLLSGSAAGFSAESQAFGDLSQTTASKALIGVFEGSTDAKKNKYGKSTPINEVAVIRASDKGAMIASITIDKEVPCVLLDEEEKELERGRKQIEANLDTKIKRHRITKEEKESILGKLSTTQNYSSLKTSDIVIEAVSDNLSRKQELIRQIESVMGPETIIATTTSTLLVQELAEASSRPENIIGMHYFSPVDKIQLLEVVTSNQTSEEVLARAVSLGLKQGKMIVVVKDSPGFFVNRCLHAMLGEIFCLLQEGMTGDEIDEITRKFGFFVGAATLADEVGLDIVEHFLKVLNAQTVEVVSDLVKAGFKGRSTGLGIFDYSAGKDAKKTLYLEAIKIFAKHKKESDPACSSMEDRQLRIISRFINEAVICLEKGIISTPTDGDVASVFGVGFPPVWGGPFRFLDLYGAKELVEKMEKYAKIYGKEFEPCELLRGHAKTGKKFYV